MLFFRGETPRTNLVSESPQTKINLHLSVPKTVSSHPSPQILPYGRLQICFPFPLYLQGQNSNLQSAQFSVTGKAKKRGAFGGVERVNVQGREKAG